jgi:putative ABC transport system permease protein
MLFNNLKIAFRNLIRNKGYSFINIFGLALGMACTILILLWINHETSYDSFHKKKDRIFRVCESLRLNGREFNVATTPAPTAETMVAEFPEIEESVRFYTMWKAEFKYNKKIVKINNWAYVDSTLLDIFSIELVKGNPKNILRNPGSIILSETTSKKIFGNQNPIGQVLTMNEDSPVTVEGVYKDLPNNSHFRFNFMAPMSAWPNSRETSWLNVEYYTYLLLKPNTDVKRLKSKFENFAYKHFGPEVEKLYGKTIEELAKGGDGAEFILQPLEKIYLHSHKTDEIGKTGDIRHLFIMGAIGLFILIIACINFMNLSTAQSLKRAKEVGLKKTLGASRRKVMIQFFGESLLLAFISLNFALVIAKLLLPTFNHLAQKELILDYSNTKIILELLAIVFLTGLFAGSYPAVYLSSFQPIKTLKGISMSDRKARIFRSILVIFQFSASIILIVATTTVFRQLNYVNKKDLGYNKENILIIKNCDNLGNSIRSFRDELLKNPEIQNATISGFLPVPSYNSTTNVFTGEHSSKEDYFLVNLWRVDHNYVPTLNIEMVEGRNFNPLLASDSTAAIINETALRKFGWTTFEGRNISRMTDLHGGTKPLKIIGVFKDFHFQSLHRQIEPLVLYHGEHNATISLRYNSTDTKKTISYVKSLWKQFLPTKEFQYSFLDERFAQMYDKEQRSGTIFSIFTLISIFVACLGLWGLASYTAEQKVKELGVRKVLGASIQNLIFLLIKQFSQWVLLASVISIPVAYLFMNKWLESFAFHTNLPWWIFVMGALTALLIAAATTSYQAWRSATRNPIESLKYE